MMQLYSIFTEFSTNRVWCNFTIYSQSLAGGQTHRMSKVFHTHTKSSTALGDKSQTIIALPQRMHYKTEKHTRHELANRMGETNKYKLVNKTFACFVMICGIKPWWNGNCFWDWGYTFRMVGCTLVRYCMYTRRLQCNIAKWEWDGNT